MPSLSAASQDTPEQVGDANAVLIPVFQQNVQFEQYTHGPAKSLEL